MPSISRTVRAMRWLAFLLAFSIAVAVPLGYFLTMHGALTGELAAEAEINARLITSIVNENPGLWEFEGVRMEAYLSRRPPESTPEARRIFNRHGELVAANVDAILPPTATRSAPLYDSGVVVGRLDIARSLRPILIRTALVALATLALGAAACAYFLLAPLRVLSKKENELLRSEEKYRKLIETASDAIIVFDMASEVVLEMNQSALRMLGVDRNHAAGKMLSDILPAGYAERFRRLSHPLADDGTIPHDNVLLRGSDGGYTEQEVSASVMELEGQKIVQCRFRDVTERNRAEAELQKAFDQIKTLRGIVPICSGCKKIRDDKGYWSQVEVYVSEHTEAEFSHGLCPECLKRLYG
jgi:PAS domain S-box-containing protein